MEPDEPDAAMATDASIVVDSNHRDSGMSISDSGIDTGNPGDAMVQSDVGALNDAMLPPDAEADGALVDAGSCLSPNQVDRCGTCDADPGNDCVQDCAGVWGGSAVLDMCDVCDADPSNDCVEDCNGDWGGSALMDMCGRCDADPTNDCPQDCAGNWGGTALQDMCGTCDSDPSNDCVQDCAGNWGGTAVVDRCDTCDADPSNDCVQDCAGVWGGDSTLDMCGVCDRNPRNDCVQDCNGQWGGDAELDHCGVCDADVANDCGPFDLFVDPINGDDTAPGTFSEPVRTLGHAMTLVSAGDVVHAEPGVYGDSNGDTWPVMVPNGVTIIGDLGAAGEGPVPTRIEGVGAIEMGFHAALVLGDNTRIRGLSFDTTSGLNRASVRVQSADVVVDTNTFVAGYAGIYAFGSTNLRVEDNTLMNSSYGVFVTSSASGLEIVDNRITMASLPIVLFVNQSVLVRGNFIVGRGQNGVYATGGAHRVEGNEFASPVGYTYGCVSAWSNAHVTMRDNLCNAGDRFGVTIRDSGNVDMGQADDPGGNTFTGNATIVSIQAATSVTAIGNEWPQGSEPDCAIDIDTSAGGELIWGTDGGQQCP